MKTNNLIYSTSKQDKNMNVFVKIRLNDECKNGHQDFAITANVYEPNKPTTERNMIGCGCMHEDILSLFPEFKIFVNLHLSDCNGIPMYAVENGFYHLRNGFNNTPITSKDFKKEFCEYYRMNSKQFDIINESENKLEYAILLKELGILEQWQNEANEAIKLLEKLTGNEFLNDSKKSQYNAPKIEDVQNFKEKKKVGFYSLENKRKRANEKRIADKKLKIKGIQDDYTKSVAKLESEKNVKLWIISHIERINKKALNRKKGFNLDFSFDNYIYYDHTFEIKFNWLDYKTTMTKVEFKMFCDNLNESDFNKLPANISFNFGDIEKFSR